MYSSRLIYKYVFVIIIVTTLFDLINATIRKYLLPSNYDMVIPPKPSGGPIDVAVSITELRLLSVNEGELSISIDLLINLKWNEPRLNITNQTLSIMQDQLIVDKSWDKKVWYPSIFFKNGIKGDMYLDKSPMSYFEIFNNSDIQKTQRVSVVLFCHMNFHKYPHDKHWCYINIMMMSHRIKTVRMRWVKSELSQDIYNTDYLVSLNHSESIDCTDYKNPRSFSCLRTSIILDRGLGYFVSRKYVPSFIVVSTSFVGFWIPSHSYPARVTLIVTSLLSLITQQVQTVHIYASYIISIHIWHNICTTFVFLGLIEFAFAICWENSKQQNTCITTVDEDIIVNSKDFCFINRPISPLKNYGRNSNLVDSYAKIIFPISYILATFFYIIWIYNIPELRQ